MIFYFLKELVCFIIRIRFIFFRLSPSKLSIFVSLKIAFKLFSFSLYFFSGFKNKPFVRFGSAKVEIIPLIPNIFYLFFQLIRKSLIYNNNF